jgi:hypothetical protein
MHVPTSRLNPTSVRIDVIGLMERIIAEAGATRNAPLRDLS